MSILDRFRHRLASADALLPLAIIGMFSGIVTGMIVVLFRMFIEVGQVALIGVDDPEAYELLPWAWRLCLPIVGGILVGYLFHRASVGARQVGVVHVMQRLAQHAGRLRLRNMVMQFLGGALSIIFGQSVGREGPAIHLGAASSSLLGQWLQLPNNSLRIIVACGTAAAIAAAFNTPIAGVIFAMEVVLMEYTTIGFTPVILASVAATWLARTVYGSAPAFDVPALHMMSLWELPYILFVGVTLGAISAGFIHAVRFIDQYSRRYPIWLHIATAGLVSGLGAVIAPQIMGIGYDTVELSFLGELTLTTLLLLAVIKLAATTMCIGLGVPGGLIGPVLVIGASFGGVMGIIGETLMPTHSSPSGLYAMLGMGAMMGATLQAPLAALMALLELTANPNIILPAMFAIVTASLTTKVAFKKDSVFVTMLAGRGLDYRYDPVSVSLSRTAVGAVMSRQFVILDRISEMHKARDALSGDPEWVLICDGQNIIDATPCASFRAHLESKPENTETFDLIGNSDLLAKIATVRPQATLREALDRLERRGAKVALVSANTLTTRHGVFGVLTRDQIEASVRYGI